MIKKITEEEILEKIKNKTEEMEESSSFSEKEYPFIDYLENIESQLVELLPDIKVIPYEEVVQNGKILLKFLVKLNKKEIYLFLSNEYVCYNHPFFQKDNYSAFNRSYNVTNNGEFNFVLTDIVNHFSDDVVLEKRYTEELEEIVSYISKKYEITKNKTETVLNHSYRRQKSILDKYKLYFKIQDKIIVLECDFRLTPYSLNILENNSTPFKDENKKTIVSWSLEEDVEQFFYSLFHKGLLKKEKLYKNEKFIVETMHTKEESLKKFNNNLIRLTEYPKDKKVLLKNIEDCVFQINKLENEVEEKKEILNKLEFYFEDIKINNDKENTLICNDNLLKAQLIVKNDIDFLSKVYSHYLKLSQEYIKKRVDKYLKD